MIETGFVKAQSDNLPKIDEFLMASYFASNSDLMSAELGGVKAARMWDIEHSCLFYAGKYRIESMSAATFPGALKVIKKSFCQDEAVSIATEVNLNSLAADELLELCADAALDGVSLVAVANDTNEVVAASFNKLQFATLSDSSEKPFFEIFAKERCTQDSSRALIEFMADVDERCNLFEKYGVDCSLEIMFLATQSKHRGQNLGKLLCKISIDLALQLKESPVSNISIEDLGPKYSHLTLRPALKTFPKICQAIFTGLATQNIGKKLNFTEHLTVPYKELVYKNKTYADRLGPEPEFCVIAAKALY